MNSIIVPESIFKKKITAYLLLYFVYMEISGIRLAWFNKKKEIKINYKKGKTIKKSFVNTIKNFNSY